MKKRSNFWDFYRLNLNTLRKWLSNFKEGSLIAVEIPEGVKGYINEVLNVMKGLRSDINYVVINEYIFGSCVLHLDLLRELGVDGLIHIGHEPYPYHYGSKIPTIYVKLESKLTLSDEDKELLIRLIRANNVSSLIIYTTQQHMDLADELTNYLSLNGFSILNRDESKVIFGCYYPKPRTMESKEPLGIIVIAGGKFHALGAGLAYLDRPVFHVDPYNGSVREVSNEVRKLLQIRYFKMSKAIDGDVWVLINGVEGQRRTGLVNQVIKLLKDRGKKYVLISSKYVNEELLRDIDNSDFNVYVVFSCPRVAIDDLGRFEKPVLTPGEAKMVLTGDLGRYIFPW